MTAKKIEPTREDVLGVLDMDRPGQGRPLSFGELTYFLANRLDRVGATTVRDASKMVAQAHLRRVLGELMGDGLVVERKADDIPFPFYGKGKGTYYAQRAWFETTEAEFEASARRSRSAARGAQARDWALITLAERHDAELRELVKQWHEEHPEG